MCLVGHSCSVCNLQGCWGSAPSTQVYSDHSLAPPREPGMYREPVPQEGQDWLGPDQQDDKSQLHSRGSYRHLAHTHHSAAPSLGAGSYTARLWGHRWYARNHQQSSGRGCSWGSCGSQGCTPGKWCLCSRDGSGMPRPLRSVDPGPPEGHRHKHDSRGNHGSPGGSGHSEGRQTQVGTGSVQPRHSLQAASLKGYSHTADREGSGSSRGHSDHTGPPRSLRGMCTGLTRGHRGHRLPQGWNTGMVGS